eukprot:TRINITY_DN6751_c0_g1_i2.p1 TRINITY_DN6751_c0_g1~~TRINITY_DN6751_c0_g1_i2.p1  ORF type:complete len:327 (+),score=88.98 TRINITY_DN6751_c0_g1_i2:286-1266(+)
MRDNNQINNKNKLVIGLCVVIALFLLYDRSNTIKAHNEESDRFFNQMARLLDVENDPLDSKQRISEEMEKKINILQLETSKDNPTKVVRSHQQEEEYRIWLENYRASDPQDQEFCKNFFTKKNDGNAPFGQDQYLFFNIFKYWPMYNKIGYYVDAGAGHYKEGSITYVFDKCLGWEGLCIEPSTKYQGDLSNKRSCKVVSKCLSNKSGSEKKIDDKSISCGVFGELVDRTKIDLMTLDVDGDEIDVLKSLDFKKYSINTLLVKDLLHSSRNVDSVITTKGLYKYQHMAVDSVFINRHFYDVADKIFYPSRFVENYNENHKLSNPKC